MIKYIFISWINGYKNIFNYQGRERRSAFGWFLLTNLLIIILLIKTNINSGHQETEEYATIKLYFLFSYLFITFLAMIAYNVRRFHDANKSGLFCLFYLLSMPITVIVSIFLSPHFGDNIYGSDPKKPIIINKQLIVN